MKSGPLAGRLGPVRGGGASGLSAKNRLGNGGRVQQRRSYVSSRKFQVSNANISVDLKARLGSVPLMRTNNDNFNLHRDGSRTSSPSQVEMEGGRFVGGMRSDDVPVRVPRGSLRTPEVEMEQGGLLRVRVPVASPRRAKPLSRGRSYTVEGPEPHIRGRSYTVEEPEPYIRGRGYIIEETPRMRSYGQHDDRTDDRMSPVYRRQRYAPRSLSPMGPAFPPHLMEQSPPPFRSRPQEVYPQRRPKMMRLPHEIVRSEPEKYYPKTVRYGSISPPRPSRPKSSVTSGRRNTLISPKAAKTAKGVRAGRVSKHRNSSTASSKVVKVSRKMTTAVHHHSSSSKKRRRRVSPSSSSSDSSSSNSEEEESEEEEESSSEEEVPPKPKTFKPPKPHRPFVDPQRLKDIAELQGKPADYRSGKGEGIKNLCFVPNKTAKSLNHRFTLTPR